MKLNPSFAWSRAYWTVRAFIAAFEILYAGAGKYWAAGAKAVEPRVVELGLVRN
jgi:hypothetical protein